MICKKIQELILTDYADGELDDTQTKLINDHLLNCDECRKLETNIHLTAINPFQKTIKAQPPAYLWSKIRDAIKIQREDSFLARLFIFPKPVFAFSTAALALIIAIIAAASPFYFDRMRNQQLANMALEEQIAYLSSNNGVADSGAGLEEYFNGTF